MFHDTRLQLTERLCRAFGLGSVRKRLPKLHSAHTARYDSTSYPSPAPSATRGSLSSLARRPCKGLFGLLCATFANTDFSIQRFWVPKLFLPPASRLWPGTGRVNETNITFTKRRNKVVAVARTDFTRKTGASARASVTDNFLCSARHYGTSIFYMRIFISCVLRPLGGALLGFLLVAGFQSAIGHARFSPSAYVSDFRVLACGERAVLQRADPYLTEPLRSCEHTLGLESNEPTWSATPFCLPPYSAAFLAPFGAIDPNVGRTLWFLLIVLATCVTAVAIAKILERSAFGVALVLAPTVGLLNLLYGETVPFAIAAVAIAALALQRRAPVLAALSTTAALLEPAIGLPAAVGLFILVPEARRALVAFTAVLAAISVLTFGLQRNLEYILTFLPAHEHAELLARDQYSLTHFAYTLGASPHLASTLGSLSYVCAVVFGVLAARRLGVRMELPALFVLLPLAVSMLGGPFVHDVEIAAALPAALLLARDSWMARLVVALLAVDWNEAWRRAVVPTLGAASGAASLYCKGTRPKQQLLYIVAFAGGILGLHAALPEPPAYVGITVGYLVPPISATDMSSVPWQWHIRLDPSLNHVNIADPMRKAPTWLALALLPLVLLGEEARIHSLQAARRRRLKQPTIPTFPWISQYAEPHAPKEV